MKLLFSHECMKELQQLLRHRHGLSAKKQKNSDPAAQSSISAQAQNINTGERKVSVRPRTVQQKKRNKLHIQACCMSDTETSRGSSGISSYFTPVFLLSF